MNNCLCGKELTGKQRRYCSRKCSNSGGHKVRKGELEYENREYNEKKETTNPSSWAGYQDCAAFNAIGRAFLLND